MSDSDLVNRLNEATWNFIERVRSSNLDADSLAFKLLDDFCDELEVFLHEDRDNEDV